MASKRKNNEETPNESITGREKKKQKTALARTIAVQSTGSSGTSTPHGQGQGNAVAGPSKSVSFDSMKGLPGNLDVERFAEARRFEIGAMHSAMVTARASATHRAWQQLPRHMRRRAASHDVRRVPSRLREKAKAEMDPVKKKARIPQRGKNKRIPKTVSFLKRQRDKTWLETHIWHAKRMKMENMWGYRLAKEPTEKSFRPSHRASLHGSILHDASYIGTIQLEGPHDILKTILESCCDFQGTSPGSDRVSKGKSTFDTHIYAYRSYPYDLIGPITVLWQPFISSESTSPASDDVQIEEPTRTSRKRKQKGKERGKEAEVPAGNTKRIVWIRAHPAIFDEVFLTLQTATSYALDAPHLEVQISDLREQFVTFEIMGPKSSQVLKGALKPVIEDEREAFKAVSKFWNGMENLQSTGSLPRNMVIGFKVYDPRLSFPPKNAKVHIDGDLPSLSSVPLVFPSTELAQSEIWDEKVRDGLKKPRFKKKELDERREKNPIPGKKLQAQRQDDRIPILLVQRSLESTSFPDNKSTSTRSIHGWTLIIPAGWAMAFLPSLIYTGTRVGGQRERQTQAFESGCLSFPKDYVTTEAYNEYADDWESEEKGRWERKPPAKRPEYEKLGTRSPWRADWGVVLGLEEPKPYKDEGEDQIMDDEELMPAQREEEQAQVVDSVMTEDNENVPQQVPDNSAKVGTDWKIRPWLLRGPKVKEVLDGTAKMFNHATGLYNEINTLRVKRHQEPLDSVTIKADTLWKSALVQVRIRMCGRGKPSELAVIYKLSDEEVQKWIEAITDRKTGSAPSKWDVDDHAEDEDEGEDENKDEDDMCELSKKPPSQTDIIGYVTSGNLSLSLGEGYAVGAIPVAALFTLKEQAERLRCGNTYLAKLRNRQSTICRAIRLEVLDC
ncbi:ribonucleases P/MRP protein subunit POP1-domain-containing protein [Abortiporus biennis]|nr:ribonucleases P/MRP protein subunit POP1-domain-containing protein [Abortiporus biennis]